MSVPVPSPMTSPAGTAPAEIVLLRSSWPSFTMVTPAYSLAVAPEKTSVPGWLLMMPPVPRIAPARSRVPLVNTYTSRSALRTMLLDQPEITASPPSRIELAELFVSHSLATVTPSRITLPPLKTVPAVLFPNGDALPAEISPLLTVVRPG